MHFCKKDFIPISIISHANKTLFLNFSICLKKKKGVIYIFVFIEFSVFTLISAMNFLDKSLKFEVHMSTSFINSCSSKFDQNHNQQLNSRSSLSFNVNPSH